MYKDIYSQLMEGEEIIYTCGVDIRKTEKHWEKYVYSFILVVVLWAIYFMVFGSNDFAFDKYLAFLAASLITIFIAFSFAYEILINTQNAFNEYWITNIRIIAFNPKKGYTIRSIERIDKLVIYNEKDNFADLVFSFKKVTASDKHEKPLLFSGIKNFQEFIDILVKKNEDIKICNEKEIYQKILEEKNGTDNSNENQ